MVRLLLEQDDEWATDRRYFSQESMGSPTLRKNFLNYLLLPSIDRGAPWEANLNYTTSRDTINGHSQYFQSVFS